MIKKSLSLLSHPLLSGSVVMIFGTNFVNVLNYLYHLIMGRLLGPSFYGELAALFSLVGILGIVTLALNTVIVKYISSTNGDLERKGLVRWFTNKILIFSLALFVLVVLLSPIIASFLKINNPILVISVAVVAVFSLLVVVNKAVLQGLLRFNETVAIILTENGLKLILGVVFVYLGFSVGGAMLGLAICAILGWLLSKSFIKGLAGSKEEISPDAKSIVDYFVPVFLQAVAVTSLYSTDLIFVKHFFDPHDAGIYAATSTLGKIIFFGIFHAFGISYKFWAVFKKDKDCYFSASCIYSTGNRDLVLPWGFKVGNFSFNGCLRHAFSKSLNVLRFRQKIRFIDEKKDNFFNNCTAYLWYFL